MRMHLIEILRIFVSNLREIYLRGKYSFFSKTYVGKTDLTIENGTLFAKIKQLKG